MIGRRHRQRRGAIALGAQRLLGRLDRGGRPRQHHLVRRIPVDNRDLLGAQQRVLLELRHIAHDRQHGPDIGAGILWRRHGLAARLYQRKEVVVA